MRRIALLTALAVLIPFGTPGSANAVDVAVAAQVLPGTRTITVATLGPISDVLRAASVNSTLTVTVAEAAVSGVTPWSVTARLCGPNGGNTAADCAADPDRLVLTTDTSKKITGENMSISSRNVVQTLGGGTAAATSGTQDMSATRTIFTTTGQDPLLLYTGSYASTSTITLTPPASSTPGAYAGYLVVTLVS